jgi:hypothetical protein
MTMFRHHRLRLAALALAGLATLAVVLATGSHRSARASSGRGLQVGPPPWGPGHTGLARRLAALHLPAENDVAFHIHALLRVYVNGRAEPVPALIGIDPQAGRLAPLHTHDASGIVHIESARPYPFTLGQFFAVWGVRLTGTSLGSYVDAGSRRLRVFVDGRRVAHPAAHVLRAHDRIVVGYGPPGSFPTTDHTPFPPGL